MRRWMTGIAVLALAASTVALGDEPPEAGTDPWVGKTRAEIIEKWGEPAKTKTKKGLETLIYDVDVFVGEFYHAEDGGYSTDISIGKKDDDGKREIEVENEGVTQVPAYKKMKFKFYLDEGGRVTKTDFPDAAKNYKP